MGLFKNGLAIVKREVDITEAGTCSIPTMSNSIAYNYRQPRPRVNLSAVPEGEGVDLHFEPIGKRSLKVGEALSLQLGKAKADYERIVEWTMAAGSNEMWDVLHFKNPFKFPLTTAPAMVVENGKFNGQRTCFWTNAGEETNLRIITPARNNRT